MVSRDHVAHVVGTSQHGVGQLHDAVRRAPFVGVDQARLKGPLGWNARQRVPRDRRGGRPADRRPSRTADGTFRGGPSWADVLRAVRRRRPVWPPKACPASSVLPPGQGPILWPAFDSPSVGPVRHDTFPIGRYETSHENQSVDRPKPSLGRMHYKAAYAGIHRKHTSYAGEAFSVEPFL